MFHAAALLPSLTLALTPSLPPTPKKIRLAKPEQLLVGGAPIDLARLSGHAGPALYDPYEDGKPMLIVGSLKGDIQLYINSGTAKEPVYDVAMKMRLTSPLSPPLAFHSW